MSQAPFSSYNDDVSDEDFQKFEDDVYSFPPIDDTSDKIVGKSKKKRARSEDVEDAPKKKRRVNVVNVNAGATKVPIKTQKTLLKEEILSCYNAELPSIDHVKKIQQIDPFVMIEIYMRTPSGKKSGWSNTVWKQLFHDTIRAPIVRFNKLDTKQDDGKPSKSTKINVEIPNIDDRDQAIKAIAEAFVYKNCRVKDTGSYYASANGNFLALSEEVKEEVITSLRGRGVKCDVMEDHLFIPKFTRCIKEQSPYLMNNGISGVHLIYNMNDLI